MSTEKFSKHRGFFFITFFPRFARTRRSGSDGLVIPTSSYERTRGGHWHEESVRHDAFERLWNHWNLPNLSTWLHVIHVIRRDHKSITPVFISPCTKGLPKWTRSPNEVRIICLRVFMKNSGVFPHTKKSLCTNIRCHTIRFTNILNPHHLRLRL